MPFLKRAQARYDRDDVPGAFVALIEGLKRYPDHADAFRWMLDLYCEEIQHAGLEDDLVGVIDRCPEPEGVYAYIFKRLQRNGRDRFVRHLDKARRDAARLAGRPALPLEALDVRRPLPSPPTPVVEPWSTSGQYAQPTRNAEATTQVAELPERAQSVQVISVPEPPTREAVALLNGEAGAPPHLPPGPPHLRDLPEGGVRPGLGASAPVTSFGPPPLHAAPTPERPWSGALRASEQPPTAHETYPKEPAREAEPEPPHQSEVELVHPSLAHLLHGQPSGRYPAHRPSGEPGPSRAEERPNLRRSVQTQPVPLSEERGWGGRHPAVRGERPAQWGELSDPDAVRSLEEHSTRREVRQSSWVGGREVGRAEPTPSKPWAKRALLWAAVLLGLALAGLAAYQAFLMMQDEAVASPVGAPRTFLPEELAAQERELDAELQGAPGALAVEARLAWVRQLQAWLHRGAAAPSAALGWEKVPEDARAWAVGAHILQALREGRSEDADALLPELRANAPKSLDFGVALEPWVEGEVRLARGDLGGAQAAYERAGRDGFTPALWRLSEVCTRRGDLGCARRAWSELRRHAPEHPALPLGDVALKRAEAWLGGAASQVDPVGEGALLTLAVDRRAWTWIALVDAGFAKKQGVSPAGPAPLLRFVQAKQALDHHQAPEAAKALQGAPSEAIDPSLRAAIQQLSKPFAREGRPDLALAWVSGPEAGQEAAWATQNPSAALTRAEFLGDMGSFEEARALLRVLLDHPKVGPQARLLALWMQLAEGKVEDALRHTERLGQSREGELGRACVELYQGHPQQALALVEPLAGAPLDDFGAGLRERVHALALVGLGRKDEAKKVLGAEAPLALRARVLGAQEGAEPARLASEQSPTSLEDQVDLGWVALERGEAEAAQGWGERATEKVPAHVEARWVLGASFLKQGRGPKAASHFQAALQGRPEEPGLLLSLAQARVLAGAPREALGLLGRVLDVDPSQVPALRLLGKLLLENKLVTKGAEELGRRLKAIPQGAPEAQGEAHLWLGLMTGSQSGSQAGGRHLRQAHKLLGDRPDVLLALGDYTLEHGDGGHAVELYQRASDHPEAPSEAHLALGKLAQIRREKDLARLGFERYLRSSPEGNTAQWVRRQMELLAR